MNYMKYTVGAPTKNDIKLDGFFEDKDIDNQILRLQQQIVNNDKKLITSMLKPGKSTNEILLPIANEIKQFDQHVQQEVQKKISKSPEAHNLNETNLKNRSSSLKYTKSSTNTNGFNHESNTPHLNISISQFKNKTSNTDVSDLALDKLGDKPSIMMKELNGGSGGGNGEDMLSFLTPKTNKMQGATTDNPNEIKLVLKKIFMFYSSFGDRLNPTHIKASKLNKMISDAGLFDGNFTKQALDLIFYCQNKSKPNMDFNTFLSLIIKVSKVKYSTLSQKEAFLVIFRKFLFPLFADIYHETDLGEKEIKFKECIDDITINILQIISGVFAKLHRVYFPTEFFNESQQLNKKFYNSFVIFLKEFDISPGLIDKTLAFNLLYDILDTPMPKLTHNPNWEGYIIPEIEQGVKFTLSRFLIYIARVALIFGSSSGIPNDSGQRLLWVLEKMQQSSGFISFETKMNTTNRGNINLVPSKEAIAKLLGTIDTSMTKNRTYIQQPLSYPKSEINLSMPTRSISNMSFHAPGNLQQQSISANNSKIYENSNMSFRAKSPKIDKFLLRNLELKPEAIAFFDKHKDMLLKIFRAYSSYCGGTNTYKMKATKLIKMFTHARILKENEMSTIDQSTYNKLDLDNLMKKKPQTKGITPSDLDIILVKLISMTMLKIKPDLDRSDFTSNRKLSYFHNLQAKFDFEQFLKVIDLVAKRIYPNIDEDIALQRLIDKHLAQITPGSNNIFDVVDSKLNHIAKLMELLKDDLVVDVITRLKKALHPYYVNYASETLEINFDQFCKFCRDFEIFPSMLSRNKLMSLFYNLATLQPLLLANAKNKTNELTDSTLIQLNMQRNLEENHTLDENLFTEAIALCAIEIEDPSQHHPIAKIAYLLERMSDSLTPKKSFKTECGTKSQIANIFEVLSYIKTRYANILQEEVSYGPKNKDRHNNGSTNPNLFDEMFSVNLSPI